MSRGFLVVAVSVDEKLEAAQAFLEKNGCAVHGHVGSGAPFREHSRLRPCRRVICSVATGGLRFIHVGFHGDATDKEIRHEIETLLAEKS